MYNDVEIILFYSIIIIIIYLYYNYTILAQAHR